MKFSEQFEQEKENEIKKIEKQNELIQKIKEANLSFLTSEENRKLNEIKDKNEKYKKKLESNEFEIAIVGLEKAGKSTFANALIENNVLPSAAERCTFTSTRLSYGNDTAIVEFYTEEEFNNNFIELLKEIKYPDAEKQHFRKISFSEIEKYFNQLEKNNDSLYHLTSSTYFFIKEILKSKDKLILNGETKRFYDNEIKSENFQSYIKGEKINFNTDISKPLSVKNIKIESSNLKRLKNTTIYDIPSIDYLLPITNDKKEILKILKNVDAIIFITNTGNNPTLNPSQLNIIINNIDKDGIPLRDKLFVFGNKLDIVNSKKDIESNIRVLRNDVEKYKIAEQKRVFTGSALKHLIEKNIIEDLGYHNFNLELDSGIDKIYNELVNYYENERFEILKRKIDINRMELKDVLEKSDTDFDPNFAKDKKSI